MSLLESAVNIAAAQRTAEISQDVAARVIQIDQQAAQGLIETLQESQARLEQAAADIAAAPPLDGTGQYVNRSV